ncbi:Crp/Fnr family transcriptional regulator [Roseibium sp. RKSG952]|uniref:Crp/Fnr family transcriptional regulator n=1 Tax=Roseibium sp. RKSG952 TaxID=2529384 RepID=UPI0012BC8A3D|nr:Crp/Fnr family transcriptional regulator [Roseibium sp. RKSG952]MTI00658.1 Crp/Fnr family transcriptional regulator [Roseibium sp. RKSG952]
MQAGEELNKEELLGKSFVFEALNEKARRELAGFSYIKQYRAGEVVFTMGAPGQSMMAIAEGVVRVSVVTPTAREVTLNDMNAGEIFGEIALLDGGERSATVTALTNCTLVVLERRALLDLLHHDPKLSIRLIELLCKRVRRSDERMIEIAFLDLPARLAKLLLRLSVTAPGSPEKPLKKLSQSQSELAGMIGNSRENVNRCLRKWQKAELIGLENGWLKLIDRERLEEMAEPD